MMTRINTHSGFTLLEVMVAFAIATVMIFVLQVMFSETSSAISQGVAISRVIGDSRAISDQLRRDADRMISPSGNGVLLIINKEIPNVPVIDPDGKESSSAVVETVTRRAVRSDQLVYIVDASDLEPLAPSSKNGFHGRGAGYASHARIWYGHLQQLRKNNSSVVGIGLGEKAYDSDGFPTFNPNEVGTHWVLGRQALFFQEKASSGLSVVHAKFVVDDYYLVNDWVGQLRGFLDVEGYKPLWYDKLHFGLTDVFAKNFDSSNMGSGATQWAIVDLLDEWYNLDESYQQCVMGLLAYPFNHQRLQVSLDAPYRSEDLADQYKDSHKDSLDEDDPFLSRHVAQMHPCFSENVSDFIVEFAADVIDDAPFGPDGEPDHDEDGNIKWYSHFDIPLGNPGDQRFLSVKTPEYYSPYYITENDQKYEDVIDHNVDAAFVWRHNDNSGNSHWPYLVRIRYRLHDKRGSIVSHLDSQPGRWFEQVIQIPRP